MKKIILVIAALSFAAIVSAQSSSTPAAATKPTSTTAVSASAQAAVWYGCPKCDFTSQKEGKCPNHNISLIQDHSFYCPKDGAVAGKDAKCADGTAAVMMDCKAKMMNARKNATPASTVKPASSTATPAPAAK